jgi:hypothetical protein
MQLVPLGSEQGVPCWGNAAGQPGVVPPVPPELVPPELVPPELVPPELVPPELVPPDAVPSSPVKVLPPHATSELTALAVKIVMTKGGFLRLRAM